MTTPIKPPTAFWIIIIVALLWNLLGVMAFVMQVTMRPEAIASLPPEQQQLYTNIPLWVTVAFAIAVFGSTIGSVLLLTRKKIATPVLVISFVAILFQMIHGLFISKSMEVYGPGGAVMPVLVIVVGVFLIWYSRQASAKGWLV